MKQSIQLHHHQILAGVIEEVLRCQSGPIRVPNLASSAGFSRFHLARLFHQTTEETLEQFLRRIRLERAAYMLFHSGQTVLEISVDSGFQSPESFSRSFRRAHGCLPTAFRRDGRTWKLPASSDLHWNADWILGEYGKASWDEKILSMPARHACVWRAVGNYAHLAEAWQRFGEAYAVRIPAKRTFVTVYLDNMWTHPVTSTMRAEIGWVCSPSETPPPSMRRIAIPGGCYSVSRFVARTERNDAWSYMCGRYANRRRKALLPSYDTYQAWPLPFDQVQTQIHVGLLPG